MDAFYATVVGEERINNFDKLPTIVQTILVEKVTQFAEDMADRAGRLMDERLGSKSGRLGSTAIETEVTVQGKLIKAQVFLANVPYARIQEEGGTIGPHMIYPKNAKVLAFQAATGEKVIASRVFHPGGRIEGKHFMRDARREMGPEISRGLKRALVQGIRENMRAGL